jgi:hypothetical protein
VVVFAKFIDSHSVPQRERSAAKTKLSLSLTHSLSYSQHTQFIVDILLQCVYNICIKSASLDVDLERSRERRTVSVTAVCISI